MDGPVVMGSVTLLNTQFSMPDRPILNKHQMKQRSTHCNCTSHAESENAFLDPAGLPWLLSLLLPRMSVTAWTSNHQSKVACATCCMQHMACLHSNRQVERVSCIASFRCSCS